MKRYAVTIEAFGHVITNVVEARDKHEAIQKVKAEIGYKCKVKESGPKP
jgi:hypothetical protein